MKGKTIHKGQALVTAIAVVTAVSQTMPELQAVLPPKYAVGVLAVTNMLSAVLPKILKVLESGE